MSDTTNPREEDNLLVEGENHELLGNPESILEIGAPDETLLIVA